MPFDLRLSHARIMFKRERHDRLAILVAAANTGERHQRARIVSVACEIGSHESCVEWLALQVYGRFHASIVTRRGWRCYPPVMGGKNAISLASLIAALACTCR